MDRNEIKHLRIKQLAVVNGAMITVLLLFSAIIRFAPGSFAYFTLAFAILSFIYAVVALVKKDSPKSIIPLFEKWPHMKEKSWETDGISKEKQSLCAILSSDAIYWRHHSLPRITVP